jgi:hypothetical protein
MLAFVSGMHTTFPVGRRTPPLYTPVPPVTILENVERDGLKIPTLPVPIINTIPFGASTPPMKPGEAIIFENVGGFERGLYVTTFDAFLGTNTTFPLGRRTPPCHLRDDTAAIESILLKTGGFDRILISHTLSEPAGTHTTFPLGAITALVNSPAPALTPFIFEAVYEIGLKTTAFPELYGTQTTFPFGARTAPKNASEPLVKAPVSGTNDRVPEKVLNMDTLAEYPGAKRTLPSGRRREFEKLPDPAGPAPTP